MARYYHATPTRLRVGTILVPGVDCPNQPRAVVYLSTSPLPHYTVAGEGMRHVYEVEPLGPVTYVALWDCAATPRARVIRYVGTARGLLNAAGRRWKDKGQVLGSAVRPDELPDGTRGRGRWLRFPS